MTRDRGNRVKAHTNALYCVSISDSFFYVIEFKQHTFKIFPHGNNDLDTIQSRGPSYGRLHLRADLTSKETLQSGTRKLQLNSN
jgi:hypothetical protein